MIYFLASNLYDDVDTNELNEEIEPTFREFCNQVKIEMGGLYFVGKAQKRGKEKIYREKGKRNGSN